MILHRCRLRLRSELLKFHFFSLRQTQLRHFYARKSAARQGGELKKHCKARYLCRSLLTRIESVSVSLLFSFAFHGNLAVKSSDPPCNVIFLS